jgi:hypothetical protein
MYRTTHKTEALAAAAAANVGCDADADVILAAALVSFEAIGDISAIECVVVAATILTP